LVWWPKVIQKNTKTQLGRIQRMACLASTGTMKTTPTAAMELLLNLTLLDLLIMAEARMALYRLHILKQTAVPYTTAGLLSIWKNVREPILDLRSDHTIPIYNYSKHFNVIIDEEYWRKKTQNFPRMFWSGTLTVPELTRGLGLEYMALDQIEANASLWENMPQFFKLKFMPFCNMHMKI
jgi:hypothetical protein